MQHHDSRFLYSLEETAQHLQEHHGIDFLASLDRQLAEQDAFPNNPPRYFTGYQNPKPFSRRFLSRTDATRFPRRDEHGRKLCKWCGNGAKSARHAYCSDECKADFQVITGWQVRENVYRRDQGVCALCQRDTRTLWNEVVSKMTPAEYAASPWKLWQGTLWQADHITPIHKGEGHVAMAGLRTLCSECHASETERLR